MSGWQAAAVILALLVGCFWAWQGWLVWQLHTENIQLQQQVTQLSDRVCTYQRISEIVNQRLSAAGIPKIPVPSPVPCDPPGG